MQCDVGYQAERNGHGLQPFQHNLHRCSCLVFLFHSFLLIDAGDTGNGHQAQYFSSYALIVVSLFLNCLTTDVGKTGTCHLQ